MFNSIDCLLLKVAQHGSEKFQRLTGKNCFWLAWLSLAISTIVACIAYVQYKAVIETATFAASMAVNTAVGIMISTTKRLIKPGHRNPLQAPEWILIRVLCALITLAPLCISSIIGVSMLLGLIILQHVSLAGAVYLCSCDPLPPGESKFKKALTRLKEVFDPTPALVPVSG